jgi:hypothetical protein
MAADVVYDLCKLTPADVTLDVVGSAIEGGRSLSGVTQSIDYSGGGFVAVTYGGIVPRNSAQAKEWNRLAANLNGSVRTVDVPLWTDYISPLEADSVGSVNPAAILGATNISISLLAVAEAGQWFSIDHGGTVGKRAYRILTAAAPAGDGTQACTIRPALRKEVVDEMPANFWRPVCRMRLPAGETMAWIFRVPGVTSELSVNFVEAF